MGNWFLSSTIYVFSHLILVYMYGSIRIVNLSDIFLVLSSLMLNILNAFNHFRLHIILLICHQF